MNQPLVRRTAWANAVMRGVQPTAQELRDHLLTVHRANAGFTESCAKRCRDEAGRNTYEWLAELVDPSRHDSVLDLACGSGPLLSLCRTRFADSVALTGVDMSADELAIARQRLPEGSVHLRQALAQDLTFLTAESVDVVLCHWALTLMDPVPPVLCEVNRILARDGLFAAIVDGDMDTATGYRDVHDLIYASVQSELPWYGEIDLGDPRVRRTRALETLARSTFPECEVSIEPGIFTLEASADDLAREAAGFFYASFVLSPEAHAEMLDQLARLLLVGSERVGRFSMPINRLVVRRRAPQDAA